MGQANAVGPTSIEGSLFTSSQWCMTATGLMCDGRPIFSDYTVGYVNLLSCLRLEAGSISVCVLH